MLYMSEMWNMIPVGDFRGHATCLPIPKRDSGFYLGKVSQYIYSHPWLWMSQPLVYSQYSDLDQLIKSQNPPFAQIEFTIKVLPPLPLKWSRETAHVIWSNPNISKGISPQIADCSAGICVLIYIAIRNVMRAPVTLSIPLRGPLMFHIQEQLSPSMVSIARRKRTSTLFSLPRQTYMCYLSLSH